MLQPLKLGEEPCLINTFTSTLNCKLKFFVLIFIDSNKMKHFVIPNDWQGFWRLLRKERAFIYKGISKIVCHQCNKASIWRGKDI